MQWIRSERNEDTSKTKKIVRIEKKRQAHHNHVPWKQNLLLWHYTYRNVKIKDEVERKTRNQNKLCGFWQNPVSERKWNSNITWKSDPNLKNRNQNVVWNKPQKLYIEIQSTYESCCISKLQRNLMISSTFGNAAASRKRVLKSPSRISAVWAFKATFQEVRLRNKWEVKWRVNTFSVINRR